MAVRMCQLQNCCRTILDQQIQVLLRLLCLKAFYSYSNTYYKTDTVYFFFVHWLLLISRETPRDKLLVRQVWMPKPKTVFDVVYFDEITFADEEVTGKWKLLYNV